MGRGARIEIQSLFKEYQLGGVTLQVLRDVNLSLAPGDMVSVVGASGVGKSTFLQILGTLDLPSRGSIRFDEEELTTMTPERLAVFRNRKIGFVFQFHHLLPEFTAVENVMMPALIQRIPKQLARKQASDILGRVGLSKRLTHKPSQLSGGEQQRTAIARALVHDPRMIIADEPTGNLDPNTSVGIMKLLDRINRTGTTVLMATHDAGIVDQMRKRVIELSNGTVVRDQSRGVYGYQH
jgi:lipoprotein-releasing system ATP-binding protein